MKRENEEKEDKKRGRHSHNERETEDNIDRLSYLPDFVLILILSFLKAGDAVRTCILSSRWQHLWKHLPILTLNSSDFRTVEGFVNFVKGILSRRDFSMALNALDFELRGLRDSRYPVYADRQVRKSIRSVIRYAASQNVNSLRLCFGISGGILRFPYSFLSSSSLTSLDMEFGNYPIQFPNSLNLPALTYLKLSYLYFYTEYDRVDPFSTYKRLNSLILYQCKVFDKKTIYISSSTLLKLSIHAHRDTQFYSKIELFAPSLCTFDITCNSFQNLSGSHLSSIKQVRINMFKDILSLETLLNLVLNWFVEMTNIESLIVDRTTLLLLSSVPNLLKVKPLWYNLKSLKVVNLDPNRDVSYVPAAGTMSWKENTKLQEAIKAQLEPYSFIPHGMIDFLLQNSPSATVDILI